MCFSQIKKYRPREVVTLPKATQLVCKQQGQEWKPSESHSRAPKARDVDRFTHAPTRSFIHSINIPYTPSFIRSIFIHLCQPSARHYSRNRISVINLTNETDGARRKSLGFILPTGRTAGFWESRGDRPTTLSYPLCSLGRENHCSPSREPVPQAAVSQKQPVLSKSLPFAIICSLRPTVSRTLGERGSDFLVAERTLHSSHRAAIPLHSELREDGGCGSPVSPGTC